MFHTPCWFWTILTRLSDWCPMDRESISALKYIYSSPHEPIIAQPMIIQHLKRADRWSLIRMSWKYGPVCTKTITGVFCGRVTQLMLYPSFFFVCVFLLSGKFSLKGRKWPYNVLRKWRIWSPEGRNGSTVGWCFRAFVPDPESPQFESCHLQTECSRKVP